MGSVTVKVTDASGNTATSAVGYTVDRHLQHAFWTTPLPSGAAIASTSVDYVARLNYQAKILSKTSSPVVGFYNAPANTIVDAPASQHYAVPIYCVTNATPRQPVYARDTRKVTFQAKCDEGVPVPDPTLVAGGILQADGTDGAMIILNTDTDEWWEFWQFGATDSTDPAGYAWRCTQGGYGASRLTHPGWWSGSSGFGGGTGGRPLGYNWGVSAAGCSRLGSILTAEDWLSPTIRHPLSFALPITGGNGADPARLLPATRNDEHAAVLTKGTAVDPYRLPESVRFRLPTTFDIPGHVAANAQPTAGVSGSTAPVLTKILTAIRDYGLILVDGSGVVTFHAENTKTFGTVYNQFTEIPAWGNFGQQIPYASLVQLEVPTADISLPMG